MFRPATRRGREPAPEYYTLREAQLAPWYERPASSTNPARIADNSFRSALNDDRFLVFAEDLAEGVGDFAHGGVGFDGREDGGQEIFCAGGAAL